MKRKLIPLACLGLSAGFSMFPAQADDPSMLDEIVVTATRLPVPVRQQLADVTVITAEQIRAGGYASLAEVLRQAGGIEVESTGGLGGATNLHVRGTNANHLLVLLDGQRIGSATLGSTALEHIPLHAVARIELLRSPASSLYGMDAVGGVLQIFTHSGKPRAPLQASAGLGANGLRQVDVAVDKPLGPVRIEVQFGEQSADGFSTTNPKALYGSYQPDADAYRNQSVSARASHAWADGEASLRIFHAGARTELDNAMPGDDFTKQTLAAYNATVRQSLSSGWDATMRYGHGVDDMKTFGNNASVFRTEQDQWSLEASRQMGQGHLLLGAEYLHQAVGATTNFARKDRDVRAFFGGYGTQWQGHRLQANLRVDRNSQFGRRTNGALSYGHDLPAGWRMHGTLASSFKAPSFNDLYFPFTDYGGGYSYEGNANLRPERGRHLELGVDRQAGPSRLRMTAFRHRIADLIVASNGTMTDAPANVGSAEIDGLEISLARPLGAWRLQAGATVQSAKNADTGKWLSRRAREFGSLQLGRALGGWDVTLESLFTGRRYDNPANTRKLGGYSLFNLTASHDLGRDWRLDLRAGNLLDKRYEDAYGYNTPSLNLFVQIRYAPE